MDAEARLLGRRVAIETTADIMTQDAREAGTMLGSSTLVRTGTTREIDYADNGDQIP
ncbi:MAG TPA: hypothetical protein VGQ93_17080 [Lysobacter sp.]|nr:hypothetical protein [Lysobacter sp.]